MRAHPGTRLYCQAACAVSLIAAALQGAVVAEWEFEPVPPLGFGTTAPSTVAANVTASPFTSHDGTPATTMSPGPVNWLTDTAWVNMNAYLSCTLQAEEGFQIQLTSLAFEQSTFDVSGPTTWRVRSSLDGFTADLASGNVSEFPSFGQHTVDLTGTTIGTTAVEFRWFATGATGAGVRWGLDNVTFDGTVAAVGQTQPDPNDQADPNSQPDPNDQADPNSQSDPNGQADPNSQSDPNGQSRIPIGSCCAGPNDVGGMTLLLMLGGMFWMKTRTRRRV